MKVEFNTKKMQKACSSEKEMKREFGDRNAKKLQQRLKEMDAVDNLADLGKLPGPRCHELTGDLKGRLAVDLVHPHRLIFQPANDPIPRKPDGGLDWGQVTIVVVVEIVDYH